MDCIYKFEFPDRPPEEFVIFIDSCSLEVHAPGPNSMPPWTELSFKQCPHCPLDPAKAPHCPVALSIAGIIDRFESLVSHHDTTVTVTTDKRTYTCATTVQRALGSLLGLTMATSGCPHMAFLRPMAHFHLPVFTSKENTYRVVGTYFIGQFFRKKMGENADLDLSGLVRFYEQVETVNRYTIERIRSVASKDAPVNAIIILDYIAKNTSMAIEEQLKEIRDLWAVYTEAT